MTTATAMAKPDRVTLRSASQDIGALAAREMVMWAGQPTFVVLTLVQPVVFVVLFRYVFGGSIAAAVGGNYANYLVPGVVAQSMAFGAMATAFGLAADLETGRLDQFRVLRIFGGAVVLGRLVADAIRAAVTTLVVVVVGVAVGFRFGGGFVDSLAFFAVATLFGTSACAVGAVMAFVVRKAQSVQALMLLILFPVTFVSSAFAPVDGMPRLLRAVATHQPFTVVVDSLRAFSAGRDASAVGALAWTIGVLLPATWIAVRAYHHET
ncbi:MAG: type transport system permease protein [Actinomycetota bacterium]|jgi:ABC-2 type transport system permease protein/oleandomycin transport system permease protein